jgi:ComF family protein
MRCPALLARAAAPWSALLERAEAELMPRRCPFCGTRVPGVGCLICDGCMQDLPPNDPACRSCAMPIGAATEAVCAGCQLRPPPFTRSVVPFAYAYPLDAAIRAMKFRRRLYYLPAFAALLTEAAAALPGDVDAVLPVPLHRLRLATRGFNQAFELARPVAAALNLPLLHCIHRRRHTPYQSGLAPRERRRNLAGAFRLQGDVDADHVVIVDDVVTTGTTCAQLAVLLRQSGVRRVSVLALARAAGR